VILIDYSQVAIGNLHQQLKMAENVEPSLLRHMVLNSIRKLNKSFSSQYGNVVICADGSQYWRKGIFPYYKAGRKKTREDSGIDWNTVFEVLRELRHEIKENFPYRVLCVQGAEADDIIAVLAKHFHKQEKILIASGDHDFSQLQVFPNVDQYSPIKDEFIRSVDPRRDLQEHIIRGDKGDGIPNLLSADDCFVNGVRQSPIREIKLNVWVKQKPEEYCDEKMLRNYHRNKQLVDLSQIPDHVENSIMSAWDEKPKGARNKIYPYFVKMRMKNLLDCIHEF
jgi:hypothetical protein